MEYVRADECHAQALWSAACGWMLQVNVTECGGWVPWVTAAENEPVGATECKQALWNMRPPCYPWASQEKKQWEQNQLATSCQLSH